MSSITTGVQTPSNNINSRGMTYDPALFLGNVANVQLAQIQFAPYTGGVTSTDGYKKGLAIAQFTAGGNSGQYVNFDATGTNGQNVCVGFLVDDRIPVYQYGSTTLPFRTPDANDRFTIVYGSANIFLAVLSATGTAGVADVLAALATMAIKNVIINNTYVYIP